MSACAIEVTGMTEAQRSSRTMNHMDPDTKLVHIRLEEWGQWARDAGVMGYPAQSLTEKAAKYGKLGIPQEPLNKPESMMPERVAQVDAAVCRLGAIDRQAIRLYYTRWEPVEALAKEMPGRMRARQFQNVMQRARWRVGVYLETADKKT